MWIASLDDLQSNDTLLLQQSGAVLVLTLNRPAQRNAMNIEMVQAIQRVFQAIATDVDIRAVVIRGSEGNFCAGGDIKEMAQLAIEAEQQGSSQVYADFNRQFGQMLQQVQQAPQTVVVVLEGAVLGGGLGLACVSDMALSLNTAQFALPETQLGIIPAQIAPFVLQRVGLTQARRLALLGERFNAIAALHYGIIHEVLPDSMALTQRLSEVLQQIQRCAPMASRRTKQLLLDQAEIDLSTVLDAAAQCFAEAVTGAEGVEGTQAFVQKRLPDWALPLEG